MDPFADFMLPVLPFLVGGLSGSGDPSFTSSILCFSPVVTSCSVHILVFSDLSASGWHSRKCYERALVLYIYTEVVVPMTSILDISRLLESCIFNCRGS